MTRLPASQLRDELTDVIGRVAYGHERIVLERYGRGLLALVPIEDLELLEALENRADIEAAREALEEAKVCGTRPLADIRAEIGK
jgi:prevent-host-death family protein